MQLFIISLSFYWYLPQGPFLKWKKKPDFINTSTFLLLRIKTHLCLSALIFVWVPWNARTMKIRSFLCVWILITDTQHYCFRRHDTTKLPEENIGKTFSDINHTSVFLGQSHKAIKIKAKINKWDLIKFISFFLRQRKP